MSISICHGECYRDPDTGEIFCPCAPGGWVSECPKAALAEAAGEEVRDEQAS